MDEKELTFKQRRFVELYQGNGTDAARQAGYTGNDNTLAQTAFDLLRNPKIKELIATREQDDSNKNVADRTRRQEFWTDIMYDVSLDIRARLRASELLAKSNGDFADQGKKGEDGPTLEELIMGSYTQEELERSSSKVKR